MKLTEFAFFLAFGLAFSFMATAEAAPEASAPPPHGAGGASDTLSALGSDVTFAISFSVARELLDAARESQISEEVLVAVVLISSMCVAAIPKALLLLQTQFRRTMRINGWTSQGEPKEESSNLFEFAGIFVDLSRRISISTTIQLLSSAAVSNNSNRVVRIVSLLASATFFLFLGTTATTSARGKGQ